MTTDQPTRESATHPYLPKWYLLLFVVWVGIAFPQVVKAGHASGVDITYECIASCTVRVNFKAYRDCGSSIPTISPVNTLSIITPSGCVAPTQIGAWLNVGVVEVTPVCPGTPTQCNTPGAAIKGVTEHFWIGDFDFCAANCSNYEVNWAICCRNNSITTLVSPNTTNIFASTTINPLLTPCNNSPSFDNPPTPYICEGQSYIFSQGATDPDGDSLAYVLGPCLNNANQPVFSFPWITPQQPLGPDWDVQLNANTGDLSIQPNPAGPNPGSPQVAVVCIYVEEWRDSTLINTIQRDIQLTVIPCPNNTQPTIPGALNVQNGTANNFTVTSCYGQQVCWYVRAIDPDVGQTQTIVWDESLKSLGATLTLAGNPSVQDTIVGSNQTAEFCWLPPAPGTYNFTVTITDDACPLYGFNQYTYTLHVEELDILRLDTTLNCSQAGICALPLTGTAPYSFQWTGASGINTTDSCWTQGFPGPGAYPYYLEVVDSAGCRAEIDDTLFLTNNVVALAGIDTAICAGLPYVMGDSMATTNNWVIEWSSGANLNDSTLANPIFIPPPAGTTPINETFFLHITDTLTQCVDSDSVTLTILPIPSSNFALPTDACVGDKITIPYAGGSAANVAFDWQFSNGAPANSTTVGPHKVTWNSPGLHEVTLQVTEAGCSSAVTRDTIWVHPIPIAQIDTVAPQCLGSNNFSLYSLGSYGSTAVYDWNFGPQGSAPTDSLAFLNNLVFSAPDTHWVTLQISEYGCASALDSQMVVVKPDPDPSWSFIASQQCFPANSFNFFTTGLNDPSTQFQWSFQDGLPPASTSLTPTVSFANQGAKEVILTADLDGCLAVEIDTIDVFPSPQAVAGPDTSFCEGTSGVELSGTVIGGTAPFTYNWWCDSTVSFAWAVDSLSDNDPQVVADSTIWVYVEVTDINGCTSEVDSLQVQVLPKPWADAGQDTSICENGPCVALSPTLQPGPPQAFQWYPAAGLNNPNTLSPCAAPDSTTTYSIVVTNLLTGCRSDSGGIDPAAQVEVAVRPAPVADAGIDVEICPGDSIQLQATATGGVGPSTFQWSPSNSISNPTSSTPIASPTYTTTYSVTPFADGCQGLGDTVRVRVHALPIADAGQDQEICLGESARLNGTAGGDSTATYSFNWNGVALDNPLLEDPVASPAVTTTYYITVISNYGCESLLDSVTVFLHPTPQAEAGDSVYVCLGTSGQLDGSYYFNQPDTTLDTNLLYFNWNPRADVPDSTILNPVISPTTSGWYFLEVDYKTCSTEDSVYVSVIPGLNPVVSIDTAMACQGDSVQLTAGGGILTPDFFWSPSHLVDQPIAAQPMAASDTSTWFTVYLRENGCLDSARVFLEVLPRPEINFSHTDAVGCPPLQVDFVVDSLPPNTFLSWNFGDGSPAMNVSRVIHEYADVGSYPVQLLAVMPGGCADTADFLTVEVTPPPRLDIRSTPDHPVEMTLWYGYEAVEVELEEQGGEAVDWIWTVPEGDRFGGSRLEHRFQAPGTYFFELAGVDVNGCWSDTVVGPFVVLAGEVDIPNVFSPNADGINDLFLPEIRGEGTYLLQVRDRWGKMIFETRNKMEGWRGTTLEGNEVPVGAYYYFLKLGEKEYAGTINLIR